MKKLIIAIFLLSAFWGYGQKQWSLEECIVYARENNLSLKLQQLNVQLAELSVFRSKAALLPGISAGATHNYNYGRTVDMYTNQFATDRVQSNNFYLSGNVTVFNGFRLINSWKQSELEAEAARLDAVQATQDISLSIATAYLQVLYSLELVNNAQNQLNVTQLQLERTRKLQVAGAVSRGNLLSIEAQAASEESQLVNAENQLSIAYLTLAQMLDLDDVASFQIVVPEIMMPDTAAFLLQNPNDIYRFAESNQPGVQSAEIKIESAEKSLDIARAGRYPSLSLSGSWGSGYSGASRRVTGINMDGYDTTGFTSESINEYVLSPSWSYSYETIPFADQIKDNVNKSIGLTLSVPLFNRFNTSTAIKQAKINVEMAKIGFEQEKRNLQKTIQQAYNDAAGALKRYQAAKKQADALREAFKYMDERFNVGAANPVEYSDSKNKLITAESDMLQARYEFIFRSKILDYYLGKEITF
ncbi:MAG: hypothetical protein CVU11_01460 [Bacteroidetes bacterium HGW-Bacteroidetes-6]|jgi:outer membrane protein|nr:MAG: hypothetical protein CVU11_01460 [Bacteroidetes bacterium HGW-Bacteroidetes-6]